MVNAARHAARAPARQRRAAPVPSALAGRREHLIAERLVSWRSDHDETAVEHAVAGVAAIGQFAEGAREAFAVLGIDRLADRFQRGPERRNVTHWNTGIEPGPPDQAKKTIRW